MSRLRVALVGLAAAVAVLVPAAAYAGTPPAVFSYRCAPGIGIGLQPLPATDPVGRDRAYIVADVAPGASIRRTILVCNGTPAALHVDLYATGATVAGGSFLPSAATGRDNALSAWTALGISQLLLPAHQAALVPVTISVPAGSYGGQRYAVIFAEIPPRISGAGIAVASRVGVREYIYVTGGAAPVTNFKINSLTAGRTANGTPYVLAQVADTGDLAVDLSGSLRLADGPGGVQAGPFPAELGTSLAPGQSEPVSVLLRPGLPLGPWLATLTLTSGSTTRAAAATIRFPAAIATRLPAVPAHRVPLTRNRHFLTVLALALVALLALLIGGLWWWRATHKRPGAPSPPGVRPLPTQRAETARASLVRPE